MLNNTVLSSMVNQSSLDVANLTTINSSAILVNQSVITVMSNVPSFLVNYNASNVHNSSILNNGTGLGNSRTPTRSGRGICHNEDTLGIKIFKAIAYSIVILTSLVCNSLVITVVVKNRRMRTAVNLSLSIWLSVIC